MPQPNTLDSVVQALHQTNGLLSRIAHQGEFSWSKEFLRSLPGILAGVVTGALSSLALQRWARHKRLKEDFERRRLRCEFAYLPYDLWVEIRMFNDFLLEHPSLRRRECVQKFHQRWLCLETAYIFLPMPTFPNGVFERHEKTIRAELKGLRW
jgi:hypothetical protein